MLTKAVAGLFNLYNILLLIRIFLSWIPSIDWEAQPFSWMRAITDPLLNIFRGIIPPIGGALDISPILAFFALQFLQIAVNWILSGIGI